MNSDEFIPTRASLLKRLRDWKDQGSWQHFFDTYWKLIYSVARKAGLADAEAQDIVQDTIVTVAKKMPAFQYDPALGSFKGWLKQITRRRIMDQLRKRQYASAGRRLPREETLDTDVLQRHPDLTAFDLETVWSEEWTRHVTSTAIERVKRLVSPAQYQVFHLHVIKRMPAKEVAERMQVKLAEVYFAKYKVGRLIQKEIHNLEDRLQ